MPLSGLWHAEPMAVTIGAIVLNVSNLDRAAGFWTQALDYTTDPGQPAFLVPRDGSGVRLHLDQGDQTHLDLWNVRATGDVESEVERLVALGATRVDWAYPDGADFVVLADPDGNLFCVIE